MATVETQHNSGIDVEIKCGTTVRGMVGNKDSSWGRAGVWILAVSCERHGNTGQVSGHTKELWEAESPRD